MSVRQGKSETQAGELRPALYEHRAGAALPELLGTRDPNLSFRVDLLRMFTGHATVDMAALSSVKFDRNDAALLARNYAEMISPMPGGS